MQIEIRASGGDTCHHCGAYELIHAGPTGVPLAADLSGIVEQTCRERESALLAGFTAERAAWETRMGEAEIVMAQELAAQRERIRAEHAAYEQTVEEIVGRPIPRWRMVKRRWQRKLEAEVTVAVEDLREQTRRA